MPSADTAEFEQHRPRLIGIAYRLTGELADAEDAVQEAWLRLARQPAEIHDLGRWLTTVVSRICLDRMRSAAARREHYVGPWLPEPIVGNLDPSEDPQSAVEIREDLRMAAMRVLHELSPDQRLAFVLHDAFDVPFDEIAAILGCAVPAARQHASRARRAMADSETPPPVTLAEQRRILDEFLQAVAARDLPAITRVLHPDVIFCGDGGGKSRTALRPVLGRDKVARFIAGLLNKYGAELYAGLRPVLVNGDLGALVPGMPERGLATHLMTFACRDGKIVALYDLANPDKLTRIRE